MNHHVEDEADLILAFVKDHAVVLKNHEASITEESITVGEAVELIHQAPERARRALTDLDAMRAMLTRAKIEYQDCCPPKIAPWKDSEGRTRLPSDTELVVERGYSGFTSTMTFDKDGNLVNVEAYE